MTAPDIEVIKDIPGYKVILKAVLKSQIQQLVEQLAAHTDEESVILTANVSDGTLSHLGTDSGKGFLEEQEDVKTQFLGFCLRRHHKQMQAEKEKERLKSLAQVQGQFDMGPGPRRHPRMPFHSTPQGTSVRHEPYHIPRPGRRTSSDTSYTDAADQSSSFGYKDFAGAKAAPLQSQLKTEPTDDQTNASTDNIGAADNSASTANEQSDSVASENTDAENVKVEAISESEFELEITGVEPGKQLSMTQDNWDPSVSMAMNFDPSQGATGSMSDMAAQQGYSIDVCLDDGLTTAKLFVCPFESCQMKFPSKSRLTVHMRRHTGEKPYQCKKCLKTFNHVSNLYRHERTIKGCGAKETSS